MNYYKIVSLAGMCMLLSCQNDTDSVLEEEVPSNVKELTTEEATALAFSANGTAVHYHDAIKEANSIMNSLDKSKSATRAGKPRSIKNVDVLTNQNIQTRSQSSEEQDTLMYLINYDNEEGYVLLSADQRTESLFAVSDEGNLNLNDTIDNPGLYIFLSNAVGLYNQQIEESEAHLNQALAKLDAPTVNQAMTRAGSNDIQVGGWVDEVRVAPLLKTEWRQEYPFNYNAPFINGKQAVAGCVSVATGQIMYYFRHPSSINWGLIDLYQPDPRSFDAEDYIAAWFRSMGDALSTEWGVKGSSASSNEVPVYLSNMGYSAPGTLREYDFSVIKNALYAARPVYTRGYAIQKVTYTKNWIGKKKAHYSYEDGHAWVIDGYMFRWREIREGGSVNLEMEDLVHCNWGWGKDAKKNGYYNSKVFDTRQGPIMQTRVNGEQYYFQYKLEIMPDIKP